MAANVLQLPVDIPWKRICVSEDMLDPKICDRSFPLRWRSSLAVFAYEPPDEDQAYDGLTVSYLKVVCSVTGYQPDPDEVGVRDRRVYQSWSDPVVIDNYTDVVSRYYGCYGAILEISVGPGEVADGSDSGEPADGDDQPYDWRSAPYFADFEPKKRELYETVSETGEMMSRSLENVNVRKGTTTSDSHEVLDVFGGASMQGSYAGTGGGGSVTGQWGTKDLSQSEYTNIRTSDQAREMRETFSHTTQLTQMYHQLDSYHLGTNRAVFFLLPRPHVVQTETGFVNGPRLLEGIQELFLVVARPEGTPQPCVEAWLETAHIASVPQYHYQTSTATLTLHVAEKAEDVSGGFGDDSNTTYAETSETYSPPDGWEVDVGRDGGYRIDSVSGERIEEAVVSSVAADHVTVYGKVSAWFEDRTWPESNLSHDGVLDMSVTVYIRQVKPDVSGYRESLYLTGRGVCCCAEGTSSLPQVESVLWEKPIRVATPDGVVGRTTSMSVPEANTLRHTIGTELRRSLGDAGRYPPGLVGFAETAIVGDLLGQLMRRPDHPDNRPFGQLPRLPEGLDARASELDDVSRGRLLTMPLEEIADRFGLGPEETVAVRRSVVGLTGPVPEGPRRWDPAPAVPDLAGHHLDDARRLLARARLDVGTVEVVDSTRQSGTVLAQYPPPGLYTGAPPSVDVVVASGSSVLLPQVVGLGVEDAGTELRAAGLSAAPTLVAHAADADDGQVLSMAPAAGIAVTPHAEVVLVVSGRPASGYADG